MRTHSKSCTIVAAPFKLSAFVAGQTQSDGLVLFAGEVLPLITSSQLRQLVASGM